MTDIPPVKYEPPSLGLVNEDLTITFKRDLSYCHHPKILVDGTKRTVECGKCKKLLDPYDALAELARDSSNLVSEREHLRAEIERWRAEEVEAKRLRTNAVAARKRVESPQARVVREIVGEYENRECKHMGDSARYCILCRLRAAHAEAP